jgi:hypothetical protein
MNGYNPSAIIEYGKNKIESYKGIESFRGNTIKNLM